LDIELNRDQPMPQDNTPNRENNSFDKAERIKPTSKEVQGKLTGMFLSGAGRYPGVPLDPKSQEEKVMFRLGRGNGAPVELPNLQQDENGKGFISQFTARVHALKHRHGFRIQNRIDYASDPIRSWYWLEVNEHGFPILNNVPTVERKTGTPKMAKVQAQAKAMQTVTPAETQQPEKQSGLFPEYPVTYRDPEMGELR
jgi:hypothetical protein